jgi:uncharacterized membrane protein YhhN
MSAAWALVVAALVVAAGDWVAVARGERRFEYALKPLALALLIAAAAGFHGNGPTSRWAWTLVALALSLAGDVFLMLPVDAFVPGLGSFLLAHVAYVVAFNPTAPPAVLTAVAAVATVAVGAAFYVPIRRGAARRGHPELAVPLALYVLAIAAMVTSAIGTAGRHEWTATGSAVAIAGALSFFVSDALIGWTRFVSDVRWSKVAIMVTYHLGQVCLTLAVVGAVS